MDYIKEIKKLKKQKDAILLVHNYQLPEIQDIADILGDSLDLSRKAHETDKETIIFCGVRFMAESAKILSPYKKVLIPVFDAGCPMADMASPEEIIKFKEKNPNYWVVSYVNTSAEVKAVSDICCTSANAIDIVRNVPADKILFLPDKNLGNYVKKNVKNKEIELWDGYCIVHIRFNPDEVKKTLKLYPDAVFMAHPECDPEILDMTHEILSTNGMIKLAKYSDKKEFIVGTEEGIIYRLQKENPDKKFYSAGKPVVCKNMKKTRINDVYKALQYDQYEIDLPGKVIKNALISLKRMLQYSQ